MRLIYSFLFVVSLAQSAVGQDEGSLDIGGDAFRAGGTVVFDSDGIDDLFIAGETVRSEANITGSAHLAGRRVTMLGNIGRDAYGAGMDVTFEGDVAGDATVAGYTLRIGEVGGDLRAAGSDISVMGDVGGTALLAGDRIEIDGVLTGDVAISARSLDFASGARIDGDLTLYEESEGALDVPSRVLDSDRISRKEIDDWDVDIGEIRPFDPARAIGGFLTGVVVVAALASLIAAFVPNRLAQMRRMILDRPFRMFGFGFLTEAAFIGAAILVAMTLIGLLLTPAVLLLAGLTAFAGYVVAAYAFGAGLLIMTGQGEPDSTGDRVLAAGLGALLAGIISLIPFFGWLFILALTLAGAGALAHLIAGPRLGWEEQRA